MLRAPNNANAESRMGKCVERSEGRSDVRDPEGWLRPELLLRALRNAGGPQLECNRPHGKNSFFPVPKRDLRS